MSSSPAVALEQDAKEQNGYWRGSPHFLEDLMLKVRKPYTITKQRERWTEEEHEKFLEALKLHGRAWRKIEEHIGTKTAVQIRSHAQKFFSKLEREQAAGISGNGHDIDIPPPRPKRKPSHPYPKKAGGASPFSSNEKESDFSPVCLSRTPSSLEESSRTGAFMPYAGSPSRSSQHRNGSPTSLKLFGKTVLVDVSDATGPTSFERQYAKEVLQVTTSLEEESVVESGVTNLLSTSDSSKNKCCDDLKLQMGIQTAEVSSRDQEVPDTDMDPSRSKQHFGGHGGMKVQDQITMNNLIALHYASFLAGFQGATTTKILAGQVNPWQLLSPQMHVLPKSEPDKPENEIIRWQSVTESNSPFIEKSSWLQSNTDEGPCYNSAQEGVGCKRTSMDSDEGEVIEAISEIKRRKQIFQDFDADATTSKKDCKIEKPSSSSCITSSSGSCTKRGSSLSTTLTLDSQDNGRTTSSTRVGGFVRYRRTNNNWMQTAFVSPARDTN